MDFDNILYILAIAAYILYSIFGKKKPKQQPAGRGEKRPDLMTQPAGDSTSEPPAHRQQQHTPRTESEKEEKSTEEILKEILTTLGGEMPPEAIEEEPPARRKKKHYQRAPAKPVKQYETAESAESLESSGSLETYEKPVSSEIIMPETASWYAEKKESKSPIAKPAIVSEEYNVHGSEWRDAVIYSEILGKPKAMTE